MYKIRPSVKFQKDLKRAQKRGYDISLLTNVLNLLANGEPLPAKDKDHNLSGNYKVGRECHITADCLLILYLTRTGMHSDLF